MDLWWRDDDAGGDGPELERLLALAAALELPLMLAVVPAWLGETARRRILGCPQATVVQHGVAHENHARPGEKKIELGGAVDRPRLLRELVCGRESLERAFADRFRPVLVPPWNRIDAEIERRLPQLGYRAVSTEYRRRSPRVPGLLRLDVHLDPVDWRNRRPFTAAEMREAFARLLEARIPGPFGIVTHHRVLSDRDFDVLGGFLADLRAKERARFLSTDELLGAPA